MENEEKPDREGYLDFKLRVEDGDVMLHARAAQEWHEEPDNPRTTLARYFELFAGERHLEEMYYDRAREERVTRSLDTQLLRIRNDALRQKTAEHVASRIEYWWVGRFRESCNFLEVHESDVRWRAKERQAARPGETDGQSWFAAKKEAVDVHLDYLYVLENRAKRDVNKIIDSAIEHDRLQPAEEPEVADIQRRRAPSRERDDSRER